MSDKKAYQNSFLIACGEVAAGIGNFASLAVLARILGADIFGQLAIVVAYAMALDFLLNFQSWRLVIRYGAKEMSDGNLVALSRILKISSILDLSSAVLATLFGVMLVPFAVRMLDGAQADAFYVYCLTILFNIVGQPTGLLRLRDRYLFLSLHKAISAIARLIAVSCLFLFEDVALLDAVIVIVVVECTSKSILLLRGIAEAHRQGVGNFYRVPLSGITLRHRDLFSFAIFSSLNDTVLKVVQQLDVFLVAVLLTPTDAGFFRIMKSLGSIFSMVGSALAEVFYPEMAKIVTSGHKQLNQLLKKLWFVLSGIALGGLVAYALAGEFVINLFFGKEFLTVYSASFLYVVGAALSVLLMPFTPMFLVRGAHRELFVAYVVSSLAYITALIIGSIEFGLVGAASAFPILYIIYFGTIRMFKKGWK